MSENLIFGILLPLGFFLIVFLPMVCQIRKLRRLLSEKIDEFAHINYQRDRVEKQIYAMNDELTSTGLRFKDANHLFLAEPSPELVSLNKSPNSSFYQSLGIVDNIEVRRRTIACLMPFNKRYDDLYEGIKITCLNNAYTCRRSDEDAIPVRDILTYVVRMILESQVVIAVLDGRNPNVFYEIGIAHASGKMVILLADASKIRDIPFDLSNNRLILYTDMADLNRKLTNCLNSIHYYD